jgi:hypothetical protein
MELNLQSLAPECRVTGKPFEEGDRILCILVRLPDDTVCRIDVLEAAEPDLELPGESLCRWTVVHKPEPPVENVEQTVRLTAENLFLELTSPGEDMPVENHSLVRFLSIMLERKRVLRPRGQSEDGAWKLFEHGPEKTMHRVPAGEITAESLLAIKDQLEAVLGIGTEEPPAVEEEKNAP